MGSTEQDVGQRVDEERSPSRPSAAGVPGIPRPRLRRGESRTPEPPRSLLKKVRSYNPKADTKLLERAYRFAEERARGPASPLG